jgi:hypothetical protein
LLVVLLLVSLLVVLAELVELLLDLVEVLLKDLLLEYDLVLDLVTVLAERPLLGLDESGDAEDLRVALGDDLSLLVLQIDVSVVVEKA